MEDDAAQTFLNDSWKLYWHDPSPSCADWSVESYKEIATISSVQDFWRVWNAIPGETWSTVSMYLMRDIIKPIWEDPHHFHGGCLSQKVQRAHVVDVLTNVVMGALGETIVVPDKRAGIWSNVTGVSIIPKKNFSIIRLWIADSTLCDRKLYSLHAPPYTDVIFKKHVDNDAYNQNLGLPEPPATA